MNKRLLGLAVVLGVGSLGAPARCWSQTILLPPQPNPAARPIGTPYFNPYYNLFRPGYGAGGIGQPGFATTPAVIGAQPLLGQIQPPLGQAQPLLGQTQPLYQDQGLVLPVTGHPSRYFNYSHYYFYPLLGGTGLGYGSAVAAPVANGVLTSTPRPVAAPGATGTNPAGQPPKPTSK